MREEDGPPGLDHKPESMDNLKAELHCNLLNHPSPGSAFALKPASSPGSKSNSPMMSRQGSRVNLRGGSRPLLSRHRSSLADIAREYKLHSRHGSINDTRKYFMADDAVDHSCTDINEPEVDPNDDFVLLASNSREPPLVVRNSSPDDPNFLFRTGSRLFTQAELELGDSTHNSPFASRGHSLAASREASSGDESDFEDAMHDEPGRRGSNDSTGALRFHTRAESDFGASDFSDYSEGEDSSPYFDTSGPIWTFLLRDMLGFDMTRPRSRSEKRQRRESRVGTFDPALALALFVSFAR